MRHSWRASVAAIVLAALALAAGCGSITEDDIAAPDGSTIEFAPTSVTWTAPAGIDVVETFTVTVRNEDGDPLNDVPVSFTMALAPGPFWFKAADGSDIAVDTVTRTTDESGRIVLKVHVACGCTSFGDDVEARSGTAFGSANIKITP